MNETAVARLDFILEEMKGRIVQLDKLYNSCTNRLIQDQLSAVIGAFCAAANELQMCIRCARDPETSTLLDQLTRSIPLVSKASKVVPFRFDGDGGGAA